MVSLDFKTSGWCLLKGGKYVMDVMCVCEVKVKDSVTSKETKKKESNCFLSKIQLSSPGDHISVVFSVK